MAAIELASVLVQVILAEGASGLGLLQRQDLASADQVKQLVEAPALFDLVDRLLQVRMLTKTLISHQICHLKRGVSSQDSPHKEELKSWTCYKSRSSGKEVHNFFYCSARVVKTPSAMLRQAFPPSWRCV